MDKLGYNIQVWNNNPILRTISQQVEKIDQNIISFCRNLLREMRLNKWVWLAAPQIWNNIRIISTTQRQKRQRGGKKNKLLGETIMINPKILEKSNEMIVYEEACISLPDKTGNVKRHKIIIVEFTDIKWNKQKRKYKDFNAVIIQHEIDHLDWILFTDKLCKNKSQKNKNKKTESNSNSAL